MRLVVVCQLAALCAVALVAGRAAAAEQHGPGLMHTSSLAGGRLGGLIRDAKSPAPGAAAADAGVCLRGCRFSSLSRLLVSVPKKRNSVAAARSAATASSPVGVPSVDATAAGSFGGGSASSPSSAGATVSPSVSDPQGDTVTVSNVVASVGTPDPNSPGNYLLDCSHNGSAYAGEELGFCAFIFVHDSVTGSQAPVNNHGSVVIFDACGTQVFSASDAGWRTAGQNYFGGGEIGSPMYAIPTSGVCWGQWSVNFSFGSARVSVYLTGSSDGVGTIAA
jgi:hypothetical protein